MLERKRIFVDPVNYEQLASEVSSIYRELKEKPSIELAIRLLDLISKFAPPGLEWGLEIARLPGITYIAEDGKITVLSVSREEFGPFIQSSTRQIGPESLPREVLKQISDDPEAFISKIGNQLSEWLDRAPEGHPLRSAVTVLLTSLHQSPKDP